MADKTRKCEECDEAVGVYEYTYPDETTTLLCGECSRGLFCPGCDGFIGGTEEPMLFGGLCQDCYEEWHSVDPGEIDDDRAYWDYNEGWHDPQSSLDELEDTPQSRYIGPGSEGGLTNTEL